MAHEIDPPRSEEDSDIYDLLQLKSLWSAHQCYVFHGKQSPY